MSEAREISADRWDEYRSLVDERAMLIRCLSRSKKLKVRQTMTLAEKLESDRNLKMRIEAINVRLDAIT